MKRFLKVFLFIVIPIGLFLAVSEAIRYNQSINDSDALYGGVLERGYPSAGYLISYEPTGGLKTCGFSVLNDRVGITASHCVDNSSSIYVGMGDFTLNKTNQIKISKATQKEGWITNKERVNDFAILNFEDTKDQLVTFAEIASPVEGCNMRVVAYGRTENPDETYEKPRKSGALCAYDIQSKIFFIQGEKAGICFGDSGSPVYYEGSNKVVGVIASIVLEDPNEKDPCAIGNRAIVVRADANQDLINENIQALDNPNLDSVSVTDGLTIDVADATLLDRLGLSSLTEQEQLQYVLFGTVGLVVVLIIVMLFLFLRAPKQTSSRPWEGV